MGNYLFDAIESREFIVKVAFATLGCRTNQNDTAEMQTILEQEGFSIVGSQEHADIYVVNTCTVTAKSDASSRQAVKKSLAINDGGVVLVGPATEGCEGDFHVQVSSFSDDQ